MHITASVHSILQSGLALKKWAWKLFLFTYTDYKTIMFPVVVSPDRLRESIRVPRLLDTSAVDETDSALAEVMKLVRASGAKNCS